MAELDSKDRARLPDDQFAYIDSDGERHLPINDERHVRNAMARFDQTHFESAVVEERALNRILAAAQRHGIGIDPDDEITKPPESS